MRFLVFGATGRTGREFVEQATARGHVVDQFVRDATLAPRSNGTTLEGDVLDGDAVRAAVRSDHFVVSVLGGTEALTIGGAHVAAATSAARALGVIGVVGAGILQADADRKRNELPDYPPRLKVVGTAHAAFYDALRERDSAWTLVCTPNLIEGPRTGALNFRDDYLPEGTGRVAIADVVEFMLEEAAARRHVRMRVGVNTGAKS